MNNKLIDCLIAVAIFIIIFTVLYQEALSLHMMFGYNSYKEAYVSDEIWYVTSARNILYKILHFHNIKTNDTYNDYYTLIFLTKINASILKNNIEQINKNKRCFIIAEDEYKGTTIATVTIYNNETTTTKLLAVGDGLNAVYIKVKKDEKCNITELIEFLEREKYNVTDIIPGWALPDKKGINNYFNLEHPPLGKYFIIVSILIFRDFPVSWRIPSITCTSLLFVIAYLLTKELLSDYMKKSYATIIALITPTIMYFDNIYHTVGILAMLDPFLAFLTLLGVYIFIKYPYEKTSSLITRTIIFSLAGLVKFSGLFIIPADIIEGFLVKGNIHRKLRHGFGAILRYYAVFPILLIILSLPLIQHFGIITWYQESIEGAIRWHTSTKPHLINVYYSPIDWFLGKNSFTLWIDKNTETPIKAQGIPILYMISIILGILLIPIIITKNKLRKLALSAYLIIIMYILLYLVGNKSLYSFYIIQFTPLLESQLVVLIMYILSRMFKEIVEKKK